MKYRPDIDGLRAVAVLLVLIYHSGLFLFPSGFVGVDVFFVISGFLITRIIYESLNDNNFSFLSFYNRRLWRLQPVFVCLILVTLLLSLLLFLPDDLVLYSESARKTALFISNIYFKKTTTGYFAPDTHQLPLLHTWSLAIEWQCYLLLPIVIYVGHRVFSKRALLWVFAAVMLLSLAFAFYSAHKQPLQAYYQFSSRIFEFLLGACVALVCERTVKSPQGSIGRLIVNLFGFIAVALIFYIATRTQILSAYPNGYALAICVATGFLIALGAFYPNQAVVKMLSWKPLVFVGLISYSLYLWHWVVFALLRYENIEETAGVLFIALSLSFLLAYLSWKFIEKPARRFNKLPFRYALISLLLLPIALTNVSVYLFKEYSGFPQRFNQDLVQIYQQLDQYNSTDRSLCISKDNVDIEKHCKIGARETARHTALLIGDSFANHYWGFVDALGKDAQVSVVAQGTSSCITLPGILLYDWWYFKNSVYQECAAKTKNYYQMIKDNHYDYVMIGQIWHNYYSPSVINQLGDVRALPQTRQRLERALNEALQIIIDSGAKPVLIKATAASQEKVHDCVYRHFKLHQEYDPAYCSFAFTASEPELWFDGLFEKMRSLYPQLVVIDPKAVQCPNKICRADINGVPVYRDAGHITDFASYTFGSLYIQELGNPLA